MPVSAPVETWLAELRERFTSGVRSCVAEAHAILGPHLREPPPIVSDELFEDGGTTLTVRIGGRRLCLESRIRDGCLWIEANAGTSPARRVALAPGTPQDRLEEVIWDLLYPIEKLS